MTQNPKQLHFIKFQQRLPALKDCYVPIRAESHSEATRIVQEQIGNCYAFLYTGRDELDRQRSLYSLRSVNLSKVTKYLKAIGEIE